MVCMVPGLDRGQARQPNFEWRRRCQDTHHQLANVRRRNELIPVGEKLCLAFTKTWFGYEKRGGSELIPVVIDALAECEEKDSVGTLL